ncbi:MAG: CoA-binding protein, partial [Deltaproteobacteria bacterium]|nr:CoA-binding protein [Deltaproteobacteria bacterium]
MENDIDTSGVEYFFNPRSIAVLGASTNIEKPGGRPIWALKRKGYPGKIYPVNPRYDRIDGLPCYPEIAAVPGEVDMAIISVPIDLIMDMLEECANKKVKVAVVFTSGFAEVGPEGQALQKRMRNLARERGIRILGPNCLGLVYFKTKVMASFTDIVDLEPVPPLSLGFVTQSGAFGEKMYIKAMREGVGFSTFISVGNEADRDFTDFMAYLLDDPDTTVLGGYIEGAKDGAKFRRVAEKALRLGKPILLKKVGRTRAGTRAVASHTGSLAGDDQIYDAFFRQMGILRIDELRELTSFVIAHRNGRRPRGRNVGILTGSGGEGVVLADKCESFGLVVPEFTGETREKLKSYLPFFGSARNPVDMTAAVATDPTIYKKCLQAMADDERIDMVICPGFFLAPFASIVHDALEVCSSTEKPIVLSPVWS